MQWQQIQQLTLERLVTTGGPGVALIVIVSLIVGVAIWIVAPKSGAISYLLRAIVGGIGIMNVGVLYAYMKGL